MKKALVLVEMVECPRNILFRYRVEDYLKANGYATLAVSGVQTWDLSDLDLLVFCTCGFTVPIQDNQIRYIGFAVEELARQNSQALFVVTGCLSDMNAAKIRAGHHGPIIGHRAMEDFDRLIDARVPYAEVPHRNNLTNEEKHIQVLYPPKVVEAYTKYAWLKGLAAAPIPDKVDRMRRYAKTGTVVVQRDFKFYQRVSGDHVWSLVISSGCLGKCSYCAIRKAKGRLKSRPLADLKREISQGVAAGYSWLSIVADDSGVYGKDIGSSFSELLDHIAVQPGNFGVMIDSLGPNDFNEHFASLEALIRSGREVGMILAVQHVNGRVLDSMRRPFDVALLREHLQALNDAGGNLGIEFHFIVGYPGETEDEFEDLADFCRFVLTLSGNNGWEAFIFSPQPGTPAASMPDQIPDAVRAARAERLRRLHEDWWNSRPEAAEGQTNDPKEILAGDAVSSAR